MSLQKQPPKVHYSFISAPLTTTMPQSLLTLCLILAVTLEMRGPITSVGPLANLLTTELSLTANQYGLVASLPIIAFGLFSFIAPLEMRGPITSVGPLANLLTTELSLTANQYGLVASLPIIAFGLFSFIAPAAVRDAWTDYVGRTFSELIND